MTTPNTMPKQFKIVGEDMSDGYHTFDELYEHRCLLFLVIARACADRFYWKPDFEGWFCLYWESPEGQISYHIPNKYLPLIEPHIERDDNHKFDGHTSQDVVKRLEKIAQFGKTEKAPAGSTVCQHGGEPFTCKVCRAPEKEQLNE